MSAERSAQEARAQLGARQSAETTRHMQAVDARISALHAVYYAPVDDATGAHLCSPAMYALRTLLWARVADAPSAVYKVLAAPHPRAWQLHINIEHALPRATHAPRYPRVNAEEYQRTRNAVLQTMADASLDYANVQQWLVWLLDYKRSAVNGGLAHMDATILAVFNAVNAFRMASDDTSAWSYHAYATKRAEHDVAQAEKVAWHTMRASTKEAQSARERRRSHQSAQNGQTTSELARARWTHHNRNTDKR